MKLISTDTFTLHNILDLPIAQYAVLSREYSSPAETQLSAQQQSHGGLFLPDTVIEACNKAAEFGAKYLWDRWTCIDETSSADLAIAANQEHQLLSNALVTIVYLHDLPAQSLGYNKSVWERCKYFKQAEQTSEFVLSNRASIHDSGWNYRCDKTDPEFSLLASAITGIPISVLRDPATLINVAVGIRIAWFAEKASRRPEGKIHALAAILGVELPVMYGEGQMKAFLRLQELVLNDCRDSSILAWRTSGDGREIRGLFAHSPAEFLHLLSYQNTDSAPWTFDSRIRFSNKGAAIRGPVMRQGPFVLLDLKPTPTNASPIAIQLCEANGVYLRVGLTSAHTRTPMAHRRQTIDVPRDADPITSENVKVRMQNFSQFLQKMRYKEKHVGNQSPETDPAMNNCCEMALRPKEPTGLKRSRSGRPLPPYASRRSLPRVYQVYYSSDSSESESDDSSLGSDTDSDDSSDSDQRSTLSDYDPEEEYILEDNHKLHSLRPAILNSVFDTLQICVATAEYRVPPADRLPPLKRAKTTDWNPVTGDDVTSPLLLDDPSMVIIPRQRGFFHLACPYYLRKPEKYQVCLLDHDLQSIEDVITHLQEDHIEPPYCPICRQPFERALVRDNHVRARVCKVSQGEVDGVNERQKRRLEKKDRIQLGETRRWDRIWKTVFPNSVDIPQPYLKSGVEQEVSIIRDFWDANGLNLIAEYMEKRGIPDQHEPEEITALSKLVLQDILKRVLHNQATAKTDCI